MAKFSTGLRRDMLVTGCVRDLMAGGEIRFYSGPVPDSADSALNVANTMLVVINAEGAGITFEEDAPSAVLSKALDQVLTGDNVASGQVSFFRHVLPGDTGAASTSARRIQGLVGLAGTEIEVSDLDLETGAPSKLDYYFIALLEDM